uniref:Carboxylic ester hydrolase n=1 Tax=Strongyloides papillosus TaxID=174720 RepID=A0A0N5C137_STREA
MFKIPYFRLSFLLLIFSTFETYLSAKVVEAPVGFIRGRDLEFSDGKVLEYLGVPFAYPPIGEYRFKAPVELLKPAWNGIRDASIPATSCMQYIKNINFSGYDDLNPKNLISEDCLELNMWVPEKHSGNVIVFIFGGSYNFGSPSLDIYNGSILALKSESIIVNLNYRLGIFGFGYLGENSQVKGNMGFLDQQVGLKWVHDNIAAFGGDPSKVTLFGESAGAASVTAHLLSEGSHPYFSKVIVSSGVISNLWATVTEEIAKENTISVSKLLGCKGDDSEVLQCLQKVDATTLLLTSLSVSHPKQLPLHIPFFPIDKDTVFFKGSVGEKLKNWDIKSDADMLIGRTADEATYFMPLLLEKYGCKFDPSKKVNSIVNQCLLDDRIFAGVIQMISNMTGFNESEMMSLYSAYYNVKIKKTRGKVARLLADFLFDCTVATFAQNYHDKTKRKVYFYEYKKRSPINPWPKWMGAMHGWELEHIFGYPFRYPGKYQEKELEDEKEFSGKLIEYIKNFVASGNPDAKWKQFEGEISKAMVISQSISNPEYDKHVSARPKTCKGLDMVFSEFAGRKIREYMESLKPKNN